jgi:hypothetical protein
MNLTLDILAEHNLNGLGISDYNTVREELINNTCLTEEKYSVIVWMKLTVDLTKREGCTNNEFATDIENILKDSNVDGSKEIVIKIEKITWARPCSNTSPSCIDSGLGVGTASMIEVNSNLIILSARHVICNENSVGIKRLTTYSIDGHSILRDSQRDMYVWFYL